MRDVDQRRIAAQADFLNRVTSGGQVDLDKALAERRALAARVGNKRRAFLKWMKHEGYTEERCRYELAALDRLVAALTYDPTTRNPFEGVIP